MTKRKIIKIDEKKCNGCGLCIPNCPEGALQMIDGKARLVSDLSCDGLGACIGHCPQGAITFEEREAEAYDEKKVIKEIAKQGENVIKAHLKHLMDHKQKEYLMQAVDYLEEQGITISPINVEEGKMAAMGKKVPGGCPGSRMMDLSEKGQAERDESGKRVSKLRQWPVQLHLVPPMAPYFIGKDVLLSADCVSYALADFHKDYLEGKSLAIACPKLDEDQDVYVEKIRALIDDAKINTLTVMTMEVPCCNGLLSLAIEGAAMAKRKVPIKHIVVGIQGDILKEDWVKQPV